MVTMRMSATPISKANIVRSGLPLAKSNGCPLGFTLIEILVVVVVVSILMGIVVGSFTGADREQAFRGYVERMALRIEMARDRATQGNREWGLFISQEGMRFAVFDEVNATWVDRSDKPFAIESFTGPLEIEVDVEDFEDLLRNTVMRGDPAQNTNQNQNNSNPADSEEEELPDVVLFSSGETTPFSIELAPKDWGSATWRLESDGFTRTEIIREEQL